jgi:hypothetical protein
MLPAAALWLVAVYLIRAPIRCALGTATQTCTCYTSLDAVPLRVDKDLEMSSQNADGSQLRSFLDVLSFSYRIEFPN